MSAVSIQVADEADSERIVNLITLAFTSDPTARWLYPDAHDFIMNTENGYDTIVGEGGGKLSVGQKQRIAIARAMLRKPQILILDEPTSALDKESSRRVIETLQKLKRDVILILVTHKIDSVINADMIFTMKDGKIIETGDHKALMANKNEYYKLFNL